MNPIQPDIAPRNRYHSRQDFKLHMGCSFCVLGPFFHTNATRASDPGLLESSRWSVFEPLASGLSRLSSSQWMQPDPFTRSSGVRCYPVAALDAPASCIASPLVPIDHIDTLVAVLANDDWLAHAVSEVGSLSTNLTSSTQNVCGCVSSSSTNGHLCCRHVNQRPIWPIQG